MHHACSSSSIQHVYRLDAYMQQHGYRLDAYMQQHGYRLDAYMQQQHVYRLDAISSSMSIAHTIASMHAMSSSSITPIFLRVVTSAAAMCKRPFSFTTRRPNASYAHAAAAHCMH